MSSSAPTHLTPSFYARLFCSSEQQAALDATIALHREISSIPHKVNDFGIARAKLAWWQNELDAGNAGTARHPLARAYFDLSQYRSQQLGLFATIIEGVEDRISGVLPDSEATLAMHCHKAMGAYMELLAALTLKPGQVLTPESRDFSALVGAGIYLSTHAISCAAHERPCELASALQARHTEPGNTIKPVLTHAAGLMHRALILHSGGQGLIYHHGMLRIHERLNRKTLSQAKIKAGKPPQLNGFQMLACAWQGARAAAARSPQQDS
ncbi:MAG: squalene/phytoene synthase family protein [Chromatiales bacterium]|nr:squalene/phytoene synthase family protein [Chromatiales bacterium]